MTLKTNYFILFFKDKRSLTLLFKIAILLIFLVFWILSMIGDSSIFSWVYVLVLFALVLNFFLNNYLNYLKYFIYQNKFIDRNIQFNTGNCIVEIFQKKTKTTPAMKNNIVYIKVPSRKISCNYILTSDFFILFCKVTFFGPFKKEIKPILIKLINTHNDFLNIKENRIISLNDTYYEDNTLIIPLEKNIKELDKINVIDFREILNQSPYEKKA